MSHTTLITSSEILNYVDIGLLVLFGVVLGGVFLAFLRGLLRGWKQGTYRMVLLGAMAAAILAFMPFWIDLLGNFNVASIYAGPITITIDGRTSTTEVTTTFETARNFIYGLLHDILGVRASPDALVNYSIALAGSLIRLTIVFLAGFLTQTVGSLLVWILWHLIFKRFSSVEHRKPKARIISGLEDAIVWFSLTALTVIPFSGLLNTLHNNGDLPEDDEQETIALVSKIIDAYDKSIFNQAFFEWTKGDGSETLDTKIAEYFADNTYTFDQREYHANIITEGRVLASIEGSLVQWMFSDDPNGAVVSASINLAMLLGQTVYSMADEEAMPSLVNGIVPLTLDVARNVDAIQEEMNLDANALHNNSSSTLKKAYRRLANSDYVSTVESLLHEDSYVPMYDSSCAYSESTLDLVRADIESSNDKKEFVNAMISGYILDQIEENPYYEETDDLFTLADLLPKKDGVVDESVVTSIDWWKEANIIHDANSRMNTLIRKAADSPIDPNGALAEVKERFVKALAEDPYGLIEILVGTRDDKGEPIEDDKGHNVDALCLFDSDLVTVLLPTALEIGGIYVDNNIIKGERGLSVSEKVSDLAIEMSGKDNRTIRTNFKREFGHILDVPGKIAVTETGKNFIRNYEKHPGIDFAEDNTLINLDPKIIEAIQQGVVCIDESKLFTTIAPTMGDYFITPLLAEDQPLGQFGIRHVELYEDENGDPILFGQELHHLLDAGIYCNDIVSTIGGLFSKSTEASLSSNDLIDSLVELESDENGHQLTHLLDIICASDILNPTLKDENGNLVHNRNIGSVLNSLFDRLPAQISDYLVIEDADLDNLILYSTWDGKTLSPDNRGENFYMFKAITTLLNSGLMDKLPDLQSGDTNKAIRALSGLRVDEIFSDIGESVILRKVGTGLFDSMLLKNVIDPDGSLDVAAIGVTYKNLVSPEDWTAEGVSMQNVLDLVTKGLDISQLDISNPSVIKLLKTLSGSLMFYRAFDDDGALLTDEEGNLQREYVFHRFLLDKLLLMLETKDQLQLFVDFPELTITVDDTTDTIKNHLESRSNWKGQLEIKKQLCTVFSRSILLLDTQEKWSEEFDVLGSALNSLNGAGGLEAMNNFTIDKLPSISLALKHLSHSIAFGPVIIGNALNFALTSDSMPAELRNAEFNLGWMFRNGRDYIDAVEAGTSTAAVLASRDAEINALLDLLELAGEEDSLSSINLKNLNVDAFLRPILNTCVHSKILNPQVQDDMYDNTFAVPDVTGFESIVLTLMEKAGVYLDHDDHEVTSRDVVVQGTDLTMVNIVNKVDNWDEEIEAICEMVSTMQDSSFVDSEGNFDMAALNDLSNYFAKTGSKQELQYLLSMLQQSKVFYRCLPPQLEKAVNDGMGNIALDNIVNDLKCADFYYTAFEDELHRDDFAPYGQDEIDRLIEMLANLAPLAGADLDNISVLDTNALSNAFAQMGASEVFNSNTSKSATVFADDYHDNMTCFQLFVSDMVLVDKLSDYFYLQDADHNPISPKDIANAVNYNDAATKSAYVVKELIPALNEDSSNRAVVSEKVEQYVSGEWVDCIRSMQSTAFEGFFDGTQNFEDLSEDNLATLLHALNNCTLYRDCVPNGLYDALINSSALDEVSDAGVELKDADFYFSYYYHDGHGHFSSTRNATPDFSMPFYAPEIDQIAMLYSLLKDESLVSDDIKVATINAYSVRGALFDLHDSYVFHLARQEELNNLNKLTVFQQFVSAFMDKSGIYDDALETVGGHQYVKGTNLTLDDVVFDVGEAHWSDEIENTYALLDHIQNSPAFLVNDTSDPNYGSFTMEKLEDIDAFFNDPVEGTQNEADLNRLLKLVEHGSLFYRSLPPRLDTAINDSINDSSEVAAKMKMDLACADFYYSLHERTEASDPLQGKFDIDPYTDEECDNLIGMMKDMSSMTNIDMDDLTTIDAARIKSALIKMGRNRIFNENTGKTVTKFASEHQEKQGMTAYQALLCDILLVEALKDYYFIPDASPKDLALKNSSGVDSADEKIAFIVRELHKPLVLEPVNPADFYGPDDFETDSEPYFQEFENCLVTLQEPRYADVFNSGSSESISDLSKEDLNDFLVVLNDTTYYYDCVPNALYHTMVETDALEEVSDSGIHLEDADYFHAYYFAKGVDGDYTGERCADNEANFERRYSEQEIDRITTLYSTLKDDSELTSNPKIGTIDTDNMDTALKNAHASYIFHQGNYKQLNGAATPSLSVFQQFMKTFLDKSAIYEEDSMYTDVNSIKRVKHTDLSMDDIVLGVEEDAWEDEIDNSIALILKIRESKNTPNSFIVPDGQPNAGDLDFGPLSHLDTFFEDADSEQILRDMLILIENGELFYRSLPHRLQSSTKDSFDDSDPLQHLIRLDMDCADYYYGAFVHAGDFLDCKNDFASYTEEETNGLVDIFKDMSSMTDIDLSDISNLKVDKLVSALKKMGINQIFNSNVTLSVDVFDSEHSERQHLTSHQALLCDIIFIDTIRDNYYFAAASPKDDAHALDYTDADTKIAYNVKNWSYALSATHSVDDYKARSYGYFDEWEDCIEDLKTDKFSAFISGGSGSSLKDMDKDTLESLLNDLNDTTFYADCVPNALYKTLVTDGDITLSGVNLEDGDYYHAYYFAKNGAGEYTGAREATPNFDRRYAGDEIEHIASLYDTLNHNDDLVNNPSFKTLESDVIEDLLNQCHQSYIFHQGNRLQKNPLKESTVFQQIVTTFLNESGAYEDGALEDRSGVDYIIETDLTVPYVSLSIVEEDWPDEITKLGDLIDKLQEDDGPFLNNAGQLDFAALEDLNDFFYGPNGTANEVYLKSLLKKIEDSALLYRVLPNRLNTSTLNAFDGAEPMKVSLKKDLTCADYYYTRFTRTDALFDGAKDFDPYTYDDTDSLVDIFKNMATMTDIDLSDFASFDVSNLVNALKLMGTHLIYNSNVSNSSDVFGDTLPKTNPERVGLTSHQALLCDILLVDALERHYFVGASEKDTAFAGNYTDADEKIAYNIRVLSKPLTSVYSKANYAADSYGYFDEWEDCVDTLSGPDFASFIDGSVNMTNMSKEKLSTLLNAFNDTTFYYDCVPNALYNTLVADGGLNVGGNVNMADADFGHAYWYLKSGEDYDGARQANPNYERRYASEEIERIASLYEYLNDNEAMIENPNFTTLEGDVIKNILNEAHDTYLFHKGNYLVLNPSLDSTVFQQIVATVLQDSGVYDGATYTLSAVDYVKGTDLTVNNLPLTIEEANWTSEINKLGSLIDEIKAGPFNNGGTLDFSSMSELDTFFGLTTDANGVTTQSAAGEAHEAELKSLLSSIEGSALFYRVLPNRLNDASSDAFTGAEPLQVSLKKDLSCADYYYDAYVHGSGYFVGAHDFHAYSVEETDRLVEIYKSMAPMTSMDLNALAGLDTTSLSSALKLMGMSKIYNTNKTNSNTIFTLTSGRQGMTAHQALLCDVFLVDSLKQYYFYATSEKDAAFAANYTNADTKIAHNVKALSKVLRLDGTYKATDYESECGPLFVNWKGTIDALKDPLLVDFIDSTSGTNADDLSSDVLKLLLSTLNDSDVYYDCVPNALYDTLVASNAISVDGVDFASADVYFSYYYWKNSGGTKVFQADRNAVAEYSMHFYANELDHICDLYGNIKANQAKLSSFELNDSGLAVFMHDILTEIHDSYVFNEARTTNRRTMAYAAATGFADLSVFEQFMYKIYNDTTLMQSNFSNRKDYAYALAHPGLGAEYKMHDLILDYTSASGNWFTQINALTTDKLAHAGTDEDPYVGIMAAGQQVGIFSNDSTVGVSFDALKTISPRQIKTLLYAINGNNLLSSVLPNSIGNLLGTNEAGEGIGLSRFSSKVRDYDYSGENTIDLSVLPEYFVNGDVAGTFHGVDSLTIPVSADPGTNFKVELVDGTDVTDAVYAHYDAGELYLVVAGLPKAFTVSFSTVTIGNHVRISADTSNFNQPTNVYATKGIKAIGYLLSSAYRGNKTPGNVYFSFEGAGDTLTAFFDDYPTNSDYAHSTYGLLNLFKGSGFYDGAFNDSDIPADTGSLHSAGAYSLYNALEFEIEANVDISFDPGIGETVNLPSSTTISISKYIGDGLSAASHMESIDAAMANYTIQDAIHNAYWLDRSAAGAGTFDVYDTYQKSVLNDNYIGAVNINNPTWRRGLSTYIDMAFAQNSDAMNSINGALDSLSFDTTLKIPEDTETFNEYDAKASQAKMARAIMAGLLRQSEQNKADFIDLETNVVSMIDGSKHRYTRIGSVDKTVADEAEVLRTAGLTETAAYDYAGLTLSLLSDARHAFSIMKTLYEDAVDISSSVILDSTQKAAVRAGYNAMSNSRYANLFYLASLYDRMLLDNLYKGNPLFPVTITDFPCVNSEGLVNGVDTSFSFANIADAI